VHGIISTPLYDFNAGPGGDGGYPVRNRDRASRECATRQCSIDCTTGLPSYPEEVVGTQIFRLRRPIEELSLPTGPVVLKSVL